MSDHNASSTSNTNSSGTTHGSSVSTSLLHLCGRKHKSRMGANLNESVATGPNAFARAQLEKLGWTEGTGLGKHRNGRAEHIRVTKRRDELALGASSSAIEIDPVVTGPQWWKSSVGNTLAKLAAAKKKKKENRKRKKNSSDNDDNEDKKKKKKKKTKKRKLEYTDEELFEATGGARFGMRAQTQQKGKWNRAEEGISTEEEARALQNTEWDGMTAPKVLLSSNTTKVVTSTSTSTSTSTTDDNNNDNDKQEDLLLLQPKRKKRKAAAAEKEDCDDASSENNKHGNKNDDVREKTKKEKKKKKSKKKDKKRNKNEEDSQ